MTRLLLIAALALTACARSEPADEDYGDDVRNFDQLAADAAGDEEQARDGTWLPGAEGAAQSVSFQSPEGETLFSIRCDERGGLIVQRPGFVARGNLALMQLRTGDTVRRLAVAAAPGPEMQVQASVPYNDQLIAALMRFNEPLEVRYEGVETLVLPPSLAVRELVRTCQAGIAAVAQPAPAGGIAAPPPQTPAAPQPEAPTGTEAETN